MNRSFYFTLLLVASILCESTVFAQANVKTSAPGKRKQSFTFYGGGGVASYVASVPVQPVGTQYNIQRNSVAGTFRVMWHPGYRLYLGLETGFTNFYSYEIKNRSKPGKVSLNAVPIMIVWGMPVVKRVNIFAGLGSYLLTTDLNYNGRVKSKSTSLGSIVAVNYTLPLTPKFSLVTEAKWMNAYVTKDDALSLQLMLAWKLFRYGSNP